MARTKCQLAVRALCEWIWCQLLESDQVCGVSYWSEHRSQLPPMRQEQCTPKNQLLGWTSMSEELSAGSWSRTVGHSPHTWCWLLVEGRSVSASSPGLGGMGCACVFAGKVQAGLVGE